MSEPINTCETEIQTPAQPDLNQAASHPAEKQMEFSVTWPEDVPVCEEAKKEFLQVAGSLSLSAEQAQKLIDLECNFARKSGEEAQKTETEKRARWAQETKDFYGPNWEESVSRAVRAADAFGGPALRELLEESGLGNHLVIVRTFDEIGKRLSEDSCAAGLANASGDKTFAQALYGNLK